MRREAWLYATLVLCLFRVSGMAQNCSYTLTGQVIDAQTGEPVPFASVNILDTDQGTVADENGHYKLDHLCPETYTVVCSHISCEHREHQIDPSDTRVYDFLLTTNEQLLVTVQVKDKRVAPKSTANATTLSGEQLGAARGLSLAEALSKLPGMNTVRSGGAGSKPVIQGLRGERVIIVNNGVRLEGQQWGDDHAPEVDPFSAATVQVVRGAAGVRYGAGALGGAIVLEPRPLPEKPGIGGQTTLGAYSNGRTGLASALLEGRLAKLPVSWRLRGTAKRGGTLQTPDYYLNNTGVAEYNYGYSVGWQAKRWQSAVHYDRLNSRMGIFAGSHIGNTTDLLTAIERGRPIDDGLFTYDVGRPLGRVTHETVQWDTEYRPEKGGKVGLRLSRQFNRREEFDAHRRFGQTPTDAVNPEIELEMTAWQATLDWEHRTWGHLSGGPGVQFNYRRNTTDRGALLPDYHAYNTGVYWIERWRKYPKPLELEAGARYEWQRLGVDELVNEMEQPLRHYGSASVTLGAIYHFDEYFSARLNIASAYRPPHPNELFSDGVHHGAASYEQGNAALAAETARQATLTLDYIQPAKLQWRAAVYLQRIDDFIYLQPQDAPALTIRGAFPAFTFQQADARLLGTDLSFDWQFTDHWQWSGMASVLRARNLEQDDWLISMPADRVGSELSYHFAEHATLGVGARHTFAQTRVPDSPDFALPPAAYTLVDIAASTEFNLGKQQAEVGLTVYNVLNARYRDYLDRFRYFADAPGRNIALHLRVPFGNFTQKN